MRNSKITWTVNITLKLCIIAALIVGALTKQQYSYYNFLRWLVMISFIYLAYRAYEQNNIGLFICYLGIAIIFNSFHKFAFQRATWHLIDNLVALITGVTVISDFIGMLKKSR